MAIIWSWKIFTVAFFCGVVARFVANGESGHHRNGETGSGGGAAFVAAQKRHSGCCDHGACRTLVLVHKIYFVAALRCVDRNNLN